MLLQAVQMAHAALYAGDKADEAGGGTSQAEGSAAQRPKRLWDDIWTLHYSRWAVLQCAAEVKGLLSAPCCRPAACWLALLQHFTQQLDLAVLQVGSPGGVWSAVLGKKSESDAG